MMLKRSMMWMVMALVAAMPAAFAAADATDLHGRWDLKSAEVAGESEEVPPGTMSVEFRADGTCSWYEGGQEQDTATYTVAGDQITITSDGESETANFTVDGDTFTLSFEISPGVEMKMTFNRAAGG